MNDTLILIRYGELSLKSRYVRHCFESALVRNIKHALAQESIQGVVRREWGRIYLETEDILKSCMVLKHIFGIVSFSPAVTTSSNLEDISALAIKISKETITKKTSFAIRVTRTGTHSFTSQDVAVRIGNDCVKTTGAPVNLTNPDVELFIEIREKHAFLFTEKISGPGGLPSGTQGTVLAIIDTPRSLLAAWYLLRRGCLLTIVTTDKSNINTIKTFLRSWYVPADITNVNPQAKNYYETLNTLASDHTCDAVVTGHTLEENVDAITTISELKKHMNIPILCPLIAMNRKDIQSKCKEIGIKI